MTDHWRDLSVDAEAMRGTSDGSARYFAGWALSAALALSTILLVWHFQI